MKNCGGDFAVFEVADEGGGLLVGQEITTNIRLSRCDEIDALRHKGAVAVGLDRRSQLPGGATGIGDAADRLSGARGAGGEEQRCGTEGKRKQEPPTAPAGAIVG